MYLNPGSRRYRMAVGSEICVDKTETYEAPEEYIRMDFDGLRESVALLMDGGHVSANLGTYQNDMSTFRSRDDVLALLVHLGYLGWDADASEAFHPQPRDSAGVPRFYSYLGLRPALRG